MLQTDVDCHERGLVGGDRPDVRTSIKRYERPNDLSLYVQLVRVVGGGVGGRAGDHAAARAG